MSALVRLARVSDIPPMKGKVVVVEGHLVALFHVNGTFYAVSNVCLHRGGPIGEGALEGTVVTCPWHGWRYDLRTGASVTNPLARLRTYEVRVVGDEIYAAL